MDTTMPDNTVLADRAERLVETLKRRDPAEAETQAVCMVMAGLTALQDVRGTEALIAILAKIGLTLRVHDEAAPKVTAGPVPENLASVALGHLRALPLDLGQAQARAAIAAGAAYLRETGDDAAALDTLAGVSDAIRDAASRHQGRNRSGRRMCTPTISRSSCSATCAPWRRRRPRDRLVPWSPAHRPTWSRPEVRTMPPRWSTDW